MFAHLLLLFQLFTNELPSPLSEARQRIEQAAGDLAFGYRQVELLTTHN